MPDGARLQDCFREAMAAAATSVAVASVRDGVIAHGVTVSSFMSVSMEPPLAMLSLHKDSSLLQHIECTGRLGVTLLSEEQEQIARMLSRKGRGPIERGALKAGEEVPLISGGCAWFDLQLRHLVPAGDHLLVVGEVLRAQSTELKPLIYQRRGYRSLSGIVETATPSTDPGIASQAVARA